MFLVLLRIDYGMSFLNDPKMADYSQQIVSTLSRQLENQYGRGCSAADIYPYIENLQTLYAKFTLLHGLVLPIKEVLQRKLQEAIAKSRKRLEAK